jgi:hypothetical protein
MTIAYSHRDFQTVHGYGWGYVPPPPSRGRQFCLTSTWPDSLCEQMMSSIPYRASPENDKRRYLVLKKLLFSAEK